MPTPPQSQPHSSDLQEAQEKHEAHQVLHLDSSTTRDAVRRNYQRLLMFYTTALHPEDPLAAQFALDKVESAYRCLNDNGQPPNQFHPPSSIISRNASEERSLHNQPLQSLPVDTEAPAPASKSTASTTTNNQQVHNDGRMPLAGAPPNELAASSQATHPLMEWLVSQKHGLEASTVRLRHEIPAFASYIQATCSNMLPQVENVNRDPATFIIAPLNNAVETPESSQAPARPEVHVSTCTLEHNGLIDEAKQTLRHRLDHHQRVLLAQEARLAIVDGWIREQMELEQGVSRKESDSNRAHPPPVPRANFSSTPTRTPHAVETDQPKRRNSISKGANVTLDTDQPAKHLRTNSISEDLDLALEALLPPPQQAPSTRNPDGSAVSAPDTSDSLKPVSLPDHGNISSSATQADLNLDITYAKPAPSPQHQHPHSLKYPPSPLPSPAPTPPKRKSLPIPNSATHHQVSTQGRSNNKPPTPQPSLRQLYLPRPARPDPAPSSQTRTAGLKPLVHSLEGIERAQPRAPVKYKPYRPPGSRPMASGVDAKGQVDGSVKVVAPAQDRSSKISSGASSRPPLDFSTGAGGRG